MVQDSKPGFLFLTVLRRGHDVDSDIASNAKEARSEKVEEWKSTLYTGSITSLVVLLLNLVMVSWASIKDSKYGRSVLYSGSCDRVKEISIGLHLLINVLSTLLLAASNFAMQCLSAPSREDVDSAHARNEWLEIGIPGVRNLWRIPRLRLFIWLCLALSSVPLHLFYNSTSTHATSTHRIQISLSFTSADVIEEAVDPSSIKQAQRLVQKSDELERLKPQECISAYATNFQSKYGSVVLVSPGLDTTNGSIVKVSTQSVPTPGEGGIVYGWLPGNLSADYWSVEGSMIDYCLAERVPEKCRLEYSLPLAIVVIGTNALKSALIFLAAFLLRGNPLLTVGDAVASFLQYPDDATVGRCLLSSRMVSSKRNARVSWNSESDEDRADEPQEYTARPRRQMTAVSHARWRIFLLMYLILMTICIIILRLGLPAIRKWGDVWSIGSVQTETMITGENWPTKLIPIILVANSPQLCLSILYFMANGILTNMALAVEWNTFTLSPKGLRVSTHPQGHQRTTHFLSLPYRYSLPLITLSALLHWLISQSIFLVRVRAYNSSLNRSSGDDIMTLGWSPLATILLLVATALLPVTLIWIGLRRFESGMPVAGACSLAIAAACHPRHKLTNNGGDGVEANSDLSIEHQLLKWGAEDPCRLGPGEYRHCTFSDAAVIRQPMDGAFCQ